MSDDATLGQEGYQIHSGPYESEQRCRENFSGVKGMVREFEDGWYVLKLTGGKHA